MPTSQSTRQATRERILDAAAELMHAVGLVHTTTKEIAHGAGCSEAALYKHFISKEELFVGVLQERLPRFTALLEVLGEEAGTRSVRHNLTEVAQQAALFYESSVPIAASLYADPELLRRHREGVRALGKGPKAPLHALATYLRAEQDGGRIRSDADPDAAAALLLGACVQRALLYDFVGGEQPEQTREDFAAGLVRTLLEGIA